MKVANFRGRKNARRVSAIARHQKSLQETELFLKQAQDAYSKKNGATLENMTALANQQYYESKIQRIKKAITLTEAKLMPQDAAEAVRTKKNRQGHIRQR